jgi:hypothetical protein
MLPSDYTGFCKLLYDWQTLIAGGLAIVAAIIGAIAAYRVGNAQVRVAKQKDLLQAHGIAVAIYPEILKLKLIIEDARQQLRQLNEQFAGRQPGQTIAAHVGKVMTIQIPPMIDRNIDRLFILGDVAGPACLQLVNVLLQYDTLVQNVTSRMMMLNADQWPEAIKHLQEHLILLEEVVAKCKHEVRPIHDTIKG